MSVDIKYDENTKINASEDNTNKEESANVVEEDDDE